MTAINRLAATTAHAIAFAAVSATAVALAAPVHAEDEDAPPSAMSLGIMGAPIAEVMAGMPEDVRAFDEHIVTLASPYMQGRVPGSDGMERAMDYIEYHFVQSGLEPAFPDEGGEAFASFRDPFPLGGTLEFRKEALSASGDRGSITFVADDDFVATALGRTGSVQADAVFVGYSIAEGPDGYSSYAEGDDLTGKVAVMLRFEPMTDEGTSRWNEGEGWTEAASFAPKINAAIERGAAAVVVINPPGADDRRNDRLDRFRSNRQTTEIPVVMMSPAAGGLLVGFAGEERSLLELRRHADEGGDIVDLGVELAVTTEVERVETMAENVGGILPGVGDLADEWIVVGAHLDHLGMGYFGSRSGPGELHPGADDNASGSAGLVLLADKLSRSFEGSDDPRRSILVVAFSGEESGLNGSRHYVEDPIVPIENHTLMINWDMIGRIENERLNVSGVDTGEGLRTFLEGFYDDSGLDIVVPDRMSGASDHTSFYRKNVPVLFSIIADFHEDYHTPQDLVWKINRVGAVKTVRMYHDIIAAAATRAERFAFVEPPADERGPRRGGLRVRMGLQPDYASTDLGVHVKEVTEGGAAAEAGMLAGDVIVRWDGVKLEGVRDWMEALRKHSPGDEVKIGVKRDGDEVTLTVKLQGRPTRRIE